MTRTDEKTIVLVDPVITTDQLLDAVRASFEGEPAPTLVPNTS